MDEPADPQIGDPIARPQPEGETTPKQGIQDATTPPGNGDRDEDAIRRAQEKLQLVAGAY